MNDKEKEINELIRDIYLEYRYLFQKYRKDMSHFSRNGSYKESLKTKYTDYER